VQWLHDFTFMFAIGFPGIGQLRIASAHAGAEEPGGDALRTFIGLQVVRTGKSISACNGLRRSCCRVTGREANERTKVDLFTPEFFSALLAIVVIDLVLAGDNAIVIALAARNVPKHLQRKAIIWGTAGAIVVRSSMTIVVVWLLKIPGLLLAGGLLLLWIAYKLLVPAQGDEGHQMTPADSFWGAMKTIVIADAVMGLDNVLAVAGAAQGSMLLVVLGLLISIPIVIWGSTLILKWVERFPMIIYLGAAVLAWTSAKMVMGEPLVKDIFAANSALTLAVYALFIVGTLAAGYQRNRTKRIQTTA
jgi:YjbE family integral membrane protein